MSDGAERKEGGVRGEAIATPSHAGSVADSGLAFSLRRFLLEWSCGLGRGATSGIFLPKAPVRRARRAISGVTMSPSP